jgi:hypothetical protein
MISLNGTDLPTARVSGTELTTTLDLSTWTQAGQAAIGVHDGLTNARRTLPFTVQ